MRSLYLWVDILTVIVPFLFSFHPKIKFYKTWKSFLPATLLITILFCVWDSYFTKIGVWSFNERYITGTYIANLPLEELLFFICIPFSCVFTYHCLTRFYNLSWKPKTESIFCIFLSLFLIIVGIIHINQLYTSVTFISTGCICLLLKFIGNINWFGKIITVYFFLLIPFFIVNGILTGTGIDEPVVLYNNNQNLNIRLLTIPIEDIAYGFELILLNIYLYKLLEKRLIRATAEPIL